MSENIPLKLSAVTPDFSSILMQLQLYLQETGTWVDLQTSSTGQTLMEMMAAVGTFNQFAIESAARETTLTTAVRDSSIYAITRMLGVRIHRKYPAGANVLLNRQDVAATTAIPTFTQFEINGRPFFNRNVLMFAQGSTTASERVYYGLFKTVLDQRSFTLDLSAINVQQLRYGDRFNLLINSGPDYGKIRTIEYVGGNVGDDLFSLIASENSFTGIDPSTRVSLLHMQTRLYEGTIKEENFVSDAQPFKQIYLNESSFNVSDVDVQVFVIDEAQGIINTWKQLNDGIWTAESGDLAYYDSTSGLGETIIAFGDGQRGSIPPMGSTIRIKYAVTSGASANNGLTNLTVSSPELAGVEGTTVSVISGGADEKQASYYRFMAPLIFKARNRGVTHTDYKAVSLDYPGIISASIMAQRDIAPYDLRWMNQIQICLLPGNPDSELLSDAEWDDFLEYMTKKRHAAVNIVRKNPTKQNAIIELTLALKIQYIPSSVVPRAEAAVRALFDRRSDTLGRRIALSDVIRAATVEGVDYVEPNKCKLDTSSVLVGELIPEDSTHFIVMSEHLINTKYSERSIYSDGQNT